MTKYRSSLPINDVLKEHAVVVEGWRYRELVALLHEWADRFNHEFKLEIDTPVLQIEWIRPRALGSYRQGRNGFGLRHQITFNALYLTLPLAETLDTLLHELLHEWQEMYGKPGKNNFHNRQFREKAASLGLIINSRGRSLGVQPGPFTQLLVQHGVGTETLPIPQEIPVRVLPRGQSKMRKWSCECTNVRCAVELEAACLKCGRMFREALPAW